LVWIESKSCLPALNLNLSLNLNPSCGERLRLRERERLRKPSHTALAYPALTISPTPPILKLRNAALPLCVIGCYWLLLIYNLGAQWSAYDQYRYGWSVPFLCAWLLWKRVKDSQSKFQSPESKVLSPQSTVLCIESEGWTRDEGRGAAGDDASRITHHALDAPKLDEGESRFMHLPSSAFYLLIVLFALLYAMTRFLHEANPIWRLTSVLWAVEIIGLTLLLFPLALRTSHFALRTSELAFPVCFFLVAVPWPTSVETHVVQWLTRLNVSGTIEMLGLAGVPAVRHGNVIEVATGEVGIDEACSGIRSFQATLMISLFLGELYRLRVLRRAALCLTGVVLAFVFNVGRTFLLAGIGSTKGIGEIASWHDPAGTAILVACFIGLWLAALALKDRKSKVQSPESKDLSPESKVQSPEAEETPGLGKLATCNLQLVPFPRPSTLGPRPSFGFFSPGFCSPKLEPKFGIAFMSARSLAPSNGLWPSQVPIRLSKAWIFPRQCAPSSAMTRAWRENGKTPMVPSGISTIFAGVRLVPSTNVSQSRWPKRTVPRCACPPLG
jgi:exosortase